MVYIITDMKQSLYEWKSQKKVRRVGLFKKKIVIKTYDKENKKPVINGEPRNNQNPRVHTESIKRRS